MNVTRRLDQHLPSTYPVLTIGNFDGLHRGHLALLQSVVKSASAKGGHIAGINLRSPSHDGPLADYAVTVFDDDGRQIDSFSRRSGFVKLCAFRSIKALPVLTPEEFVFKILRDRIGVRELYVGEQFAFGKGRSGRIDDLITFSAPAGFTVHAVPPVVIEGEIVSSTRIRAMVQSGDVGRARRFLGRYTPWPARSSKGRIEAGNSGGRPPIFVCRRTA